MSTRRWSGIVAAIAAVLSLFTFPAHATHSEPAAPNDPLYAETESNLGQWGLRQIHAEEAWDLTTGSGALIGIVDSGIDLDHEDLAVKTVAGNTFQGCGDEGCGTGDWESGSEDPSAHGTHVAGIAAAATGNGLGVAGVAPDAELLAVRVTTLVPLVDSPCFGESWLDTARGIRYAVDHGANVINISLGNPLPFAGSVCNAVEPAVPEAIAYAAANDVLVVAAAGNSAEPLCSGPPAATVGAICVVATDSNELPADYSNHAVKEDMLAVAAPGGGDVDYSLFCGGGVLSTVPPGTADTAIQEACGYPANLAYDEFIGTSMASPHVAGAAALLWSMGCTREQTIDLLTSTARHPVTGVRGTFTPAYGYGIIDAAAAAEAAGAGGCTPRVNTAPVAADDMGATAEDTPLPLDVLANDTDAERGDLIITDVGEPLHGTAVVDADGTVEYTPAGDYNGGDAFTYTVADSEGATDTATVAVEVAAVNDAPTAGDDSASARRNRDVTITVLDNDVDIDGDTLSIASVGPPLNGTAVADGGVIRYTPNKGFFGNDRFTYQVADPSGARSTATVDVSVHRGGH